MNVHPSAVVDPPGPTTAEPFSPEALHELKIDRDGDAVADIAYRVRFSSSEDESQTATLRRVEGAQAAGTSDDGQIIVEAAAVSTGRKARVTQAGGHRFFAGWRSDPFFFDTIPLDEDAPLLVMPALGFRGRMIAIKWTKLKSRALPRT